MDTDLHSIISKAVDNYTQGTANIGEHVDWNMNATIERIFAYLNSRHTSGLKDSLGREKPFFNIVTATVNIWYRATDIDRKDIVVIPDSNADVVAAFIATLKLQDWMKRTKFGVFLNKWGRTLAQYGSAVIKVVEKDGQLVCSVPSWLDLIVDPIDFSALPHIEKLYKTPAQLMNMATLGHPEYSGYEIETVRKIISDKKPRERLGTEQVDTMDEFIELYEVHGNLSLATYKKAKGQEAKEEDENEFFQQMHVITWNKNNDGTLNKYTLYSGKEEKDIYILTHLIEEDKRTLSIGAVETLFDAQWMQNHTIKQWKDQMDLSSRIIFQTSDGNFVGRNALTNIENGEVLIHAEGKPITAFPNFGHDITNLKAFIDQWRVLTQEISSTPDAVRGNTMPSSTPYSLGAYLGNQGLSLFEIMTENKAFALEQLLTDHVIPFIKKKLKNKDELVTLLEDHDLKKFDSIFIPKTAVKRYNERVKKEMMDFAMGRRQDLPETFDAQKEEGAVRDELAMLGNQRFISPGDVNWDEVFKDLEWKLDIGITNEQKDKQAIFQTLTTVLQTLATNPQVLENPSTRTVFNKILAETGVVSPIELSTSSTPSMSPPMALGKLPTGIINNNGQQTNAVQ